MKRIFLLLIYSLFLSNVHAAFLRDVPVTLIQPDGTILHCFASGDEYFNYLHDKIGYTIIQHPETGYYVYAEQREGKLIATDCIAGKHDPASKGLQPYALISPEEWLARRKAWEEPDIRPKNRDVVPNHGTLNNIAIFIRFSDDPEFTNSFSDIDNMFNDVSENAVSMRSYFRAASYDAIDIPTYFYPGHNEDIVISYQDTHPRSYFQPYNATTNTNGYSNYNERKDRESQLLADAVTYVNTYYPIPSDLNIDYDNDGFVDNVCFIVRGTTYGWSELLWPHKSSLVRKEVYINEKRVYVYNFQLADATSYFTTATMCHEMNHSLSAPDLYHYESYTDIHPAGSWDLMDNHNTPPQHCGAYMKMKYGHWIDDIPEISQAGTYSLNPISSAMPTNVAYKIPTEDPNQFYIIEYRDKTSLFESKLPGSGLLIYRIDSRFYGNADYNPNNGIYDEIYIFRPNGNLTYNGSINKAHFSSNVNRTEFSITTNPSPFSSEGVLNYNLRIYDIESVGSTITFKYEPSAASGQSVNLAVTVAEKTAKLEWDAVENAFSYNVYRNGTLIGNTTETYYSDNDLPYGSYTYFLICVNSEGKLLNATESAECNVCPLATNLTVDLANNDAEVSWEEAEWSIPNTPAHTLSYGNLHNPIAYYQWLNGCHYWGLRHLKEDINDYDGMALYEIDFHANLIGNYEVFVFNGTHKNGEFDLPTTQVSCQPVSVTTTGWQKMILSEPITIDKTKDLWIFIHNTESIEELTALVCEATGVTNGAYVADDLQSENQYYENYSFMIKAFLTDGTYTYNLYDGTTKVNGDSPISGTSYTVENITTNKAHRYTVKTNYYGGESPASNEVGITMGEAELETLSLDDDNNMTVTKGSTLTVGSLTTADPSNLILEDGAQLINNSTGVKATVKKSIDGFLTNDNKSDWYLIASPVTEQLDITEATNLTTSNDADYDLYIFNQSTETEWLNYKQGHFNTVNNKTGYLYANKNDIDIEFVGTLNNTDGTVPLSYVNDQNFSGFNLVGNPFPCNATIGREFYRIVETEEGSKIMIATDPTISPMEGVFVKAADSNDNNVTFSKPTAKGQNISDSMITMSVTHDRGTVLDIARIRFSGETNMEKLSLRDDGTELFIPQNGKNYALMVNGEQSETPIGFKAASNGTYTINVNPENVDLDFLHLIDNLTGDDIDLLQNPSYTFEAKFDDYPSRFRLLFEEKVINDPAVDSDDFADENIQILDVTGRVVATDRNAKLTPGVYILRSINSNNTKKIIIK